MAQTTSNGGDQHTGRPVIVGLDIGTSKVCVIVAARNEDDGGVHVLGIGHAPSDGLNRGVVVNIEKTVRSIRAAVDQAEQQSGVKINAVTVGIAGDHIQSTPSRGVVTISNAERVVGQADVDRLLEDARRVAMPSDRRILHVIPQEYIIDGQDGIHDPVGMAGLRMEATVHVISALVTATQNIYRCVERAGLTVEDVVLEPLASGYAVLDEDEKEVGVALVDIGGGTTDIAVFVDGAIRHTAVIGIAGRMVTEDIRRGLGIIGEQAERVKQEYGYALETLILNDQTFSIPGIGGRRPMELTRRMLCQVIQPRMEEILEFVLIELKKSGYLSNLSAGVVLTGGGALLRGSTELAQAVLGLPVKIGIPSLGGAALAPEVERPIFATAVGLVKYALDVEESEEVATTAAEENQIAEPRVHREVQHKVEEESEERHSFMESVRKFFREF